MNLALEIRRLIFLITFWAGFRAVSYLIVMAQWPFPAKSGMFILFQLFFVWLLIFQYPRLSKISRSELGLHFSVDTKTWRQWIIFFFITLGLIAAFLMNSDWRFTVKDSPASQWLTLFYFVYGTIPEEILLRAILCTLIARWFGWLVAIFVSALIFSAEQYAVGSVGGHQFFLYFPVGCFLAWVFYETRTVLFPILFHFSFNAVLVFVSRHFSS